MIACLLCVEISLAIFSEAVRAALGNAESLEMLVRAVVFARLELQARTLRRAGYLR